MSTVLRNLLRPAVRSVAGGLLSPSVSNSFPSATLVEKSLFRTVAPTIDGVLADDSPASDSSREVQNHRCYDFDGTDDYVLIGDQSSLDFTNTDFSISFWIKGPTSVSQRGIFCKYNASTTQRGWAVITEADGNIRFYHQSNAAIFNANQVVDTTSTPMDDSWHHVVAVFEAGVKSQIWVDGVLEAENTTDVPASVADNVAVVELGSFNNDPSVRGLDGCLFDVQAVELALTEAQVLELYTQKSEALPGVERAAWYKCDKQHPTDCFDSSPNANHGTKVSVDTSVGAFHREGADVPFSYENDEGYSELQFFYQDGNVELGALGLNTLEHDITVRVSLYKDEGSPDEDQLVLQPSGFSWFIYNRAATNSYTSIANTGGGVASAGGGYGLVRHVCFRYEHATRTMTPFIDGSESISGVLSSNFARSNDTWRIGSNDGSNRHFDGAVFDLEFYDSALSDADCIALTNLQSITADPVHAYQGYGDTPWNDTVGSAHGTVSGTVVSRRVPLVSPTVDVMERTPDHTGKVAQPARLVESSCGNFDGSDDYVEIPYSASFENDDFEISIRFKRDRTGQFETLFGVGQAGSLSGVTPAGLILRLDQSTNRLAILISIAGTYESVLSDAAIDDTLWHHATVSKSGTQVTIVVDDEATIGTLSSSAINWDSSGTNRATIGAHWSDSTDTYDAEFEGEICNLSFSFGSSLVRSYPFSEGAGTVIHDVSGNGHHGTAYNISEASFWGSSQDDYHHNAAEGFSYANNLKSNSKFEGAVSGTPGTPPTNWSYLTSNGSLTAHGDGSLTMSVTGSRHYFNNSFSNSENGTQYKYAVEIVDNPDGISNDNIATIIGATGTSVTINGVASTGGSVPVAGDVIEYTFTAGASTTIRLGVGVNTSDTGTIRIRNPRVYRATGRAGDYYPTGPSQFFDQVNIPAASATLDANGEALTDPAGTFRNAAESKVDETGGKLIDQHFYTRANLLTSPEGYADGAWTKVAATIVTNPIDVPDGTLTADEIVETAASSTHYIFQNEDVVAGEAYTGSVYVKDNNRRYVVVWLGSVHINAGVSVDLQTGIATEVTGFNALDSYSIETLPNGWYRVTVTATALTTGTASFATYLSEDGNFANRTYLGDITKSLYLWHAKLEKGGEATPVKPDNFDPSLLTAREFGAAVNQPRYLRELNLNGLLHREDRYLLLNEPIYGDRLAAVEKFTQSVDL